MDRLSRRGLAHVSKAALIAAGAFYLVPAAAPAMAQEPAEQSAEYSFNIPAGPLSAAMSAWAEATGYQFAYPGAGADEPVTSGVTGTMTADAALARITAGTGYTFRFTGDQIVTLVSTGDGEARMIGPVRVEGAEYEATGAMPLSGVNGSMDMTATEGTGSYTTDLMTIGSKTPVSLKDTPQSVSVITAQQLEDQAISDYTEALKYAPGVTFVQTTSSMQGAFYSRGFTLTEIQTDGGAPLKADFGYYPQIDMSQYDHIELLRGAAGKYSGFGGSGGSVNLVRKKPLDHQQVTWEGQVGSWNTYRSVLDVTGPLALDDRLRGRLVMTYQDNEYFYDIASDNKTLLYGVLDFDVTPSTLLRAGISYTRQDSVPWEGGLGRYETGEDLGLSRSVSYVFPWNSWDFDTVEYFATVEQSFWDDWTVRLNVTQNTQENVQKVGYVDGPVNPESMDGPTYMGKQDINTVYQIMADASLAGSFMLMGEKQTFDLGYSYSDTDGGGGTSVSNITQATSSSPFQPYPGGPVYCGSAFGCPAGSIPEPYPTIGSPFDFNPYDPLYTELASRLPTSRTAEFGQTVSTAFANLNLTFLDRWHLSTALRWNRYDMITVSEILCTGASSFLCLGREIGEPYFTITLSNNSSENFAWPPSMSLSYDVTDDITAYLGYADVYQSMGAYLTKDGEHLDPVTGSNIEAGVKWAAHDGRLNLALSAYWIEKDGYAYDTGETPNFSPGSGQLCCYANGDDRTLDSRGIDLEMTGELAAGWQISSSYTYSKNEQIGTYFEDGDGQPFTTLQPEHLLKIWTSYDFAASPWGDNEWLSRLTLSGGLNWQSDSYFAGTVCTEYEQAFDADGNPIFTVSGEFRFDCIAEADYDFTEDGYGLLSARAEYALNENWNIALNVENLTDETYYQTVGTAAYRNWYGAPTSYTFTLKGSW